MNTDGRDRLAHADTTIVCCLLAVFCEGIDLQAAGVAAGGIIPEFKPSPDQIGTFFSASTFGLFVGALIGGRLSDGLVRRGCPEINRTGQYHAGQGVRPRHFDAPDLANLARAGGEWGSQMP